MWEVQFHAAFEAEVLAYEREVRIALITVTKLLADYGPQLGRPYADTLKGSKHSNMKELRFEAADGEWRAAFAFDPSVGQSCSSLATNPAEVRSSSIGVWSQKRISGFPNIWKA